MIIEHTFFAGYTPRRFSDGMVVCMYRFCRKRGCGEVWNAGMECLCSQFGLARTRGLERIWIPRIYIFHCTVFWRGTQRSSAWRSLSSLPAAVHSLANNFYRVVWNLIILYTSLAFCNPSKIPDPTEYRTNILQCYCNTTRNIFE